MALLPRPVAGAKMVGSRKDEEASLIPSWHERGSRIRGSRNIGRRGGGEERDSLALFLLQSTSQQPQLSRWRQFLEMFSTVIHATCASWRT